MTNERPSNPPSCPICGKPKEAAFSPFCSQRCADIDLNRWLTGVYAVPVEDEEDGVPLSADNDNSENS